jgi:3-hydroxyisobutyrate dehydrogenase-like beta-hydroxyacid dehydrogenase
MHDRMRIGDLTERIGFIGLGHLGLFDFGEAVGSATLVKHMGNYLIVSAGYSLRETLSMAEKNGVDPKAVVDMLTRTLFPAPIYQSYSKRIAEKTAPFSQNAIPLKDIGLFKKTAQQVESPTPIAHLLHNLLRSEEARAQTLPRATSVDQGVEQV